MLVNTSTKIQSQCWNLQFSIVICARIDMGNWDSEVPSTSAADPMVIPYRNLDLEYENQATSSATQRPSSAQQGKACQLHFKLAYTAHHRRSHLILMHDEISLLHRRRSGRRARRLWILFGTFMTLHGRDLSLNTAVTQDISGMTSNMQVRPDRDDLQALAWMSRLSAYLRDSFDAR